MCKLGYCKNGGPLYQGLPMGASFSHKAIALVARGHNSALSSAMKKERPKPEPIYIINEGLLSSFKELTKK